MISGYRSPEYNAFLVKRSRRAARHSLHVEGQAVNSFIPGIRPREIRKVALKLQYGGVGYYPRADFIHLDSVPSAPGNLSFLPYLFVRLDESHPLRLQEHH